MKGRCLFVVLLAGCLSLAPAQTRVSTSYGTMAEAVDAGGRPSSSTGYGHTGSVGLIGGNTTSVAYLVTAGFLPQTGGVAEGPEIAIFDGAAVSPAAERQSHGNLVFATTPAGNSSSPQTFTIKNTGTADLTGLAVSAAGNQPAEFVLGTLGETTLAPEATTTFTVTFSPSVSGARSAVVEIASNDPDENPFVINISGNEAVMATYTTGTEVPLTANGFIATGGTANLILNHTPTVGTQLAVVQNTSLGFIEGRLNNLAQGQMVGLSYGGSTYYFVANYYGGSGNDLVLVWAANRMFNWGQNSDGQLGDGTTTPRAAPVLVTSTGVLAGKTVLAQATGAAHSLALCSDGILVAWGKNDAGQLGDGTTTQRLAPVVVATAGTPLAGRTVVAIAVGDAHSLALCADGTLVAWGDNALGQLGDGTITSRSSAVAVTTAGTALAGKSVVGLAAGRYHSVALCADGSSAAWGLNFYGQLGDGTTTDRLLPVAVTTAGTPLAGRSVATVAAGAFHNLALCTDGTLVAWGQNFSGQLGDGSGSPRTVPVAVLPTVSGLSSKTTVSIAAGAAHSLALFADGTMASWGDNAYGQLGNGSSGQPFGPLANAVNASPGVPALFGKAVTGIAAGANHSLAVCADGTVAAWGDNTYGQLGDASSIARSFAVAVNSGALAGGERFIRAATGSYADHSLALAASPPLPEISIFTGASTAPGDERQGNAGSFTFALTSVDGGTVQTFTIKNTGTATLGSLAVNKAGSHPGDFTLGAPGLTSLAPGGTTTFTVTFSPTVEGARSALVQITSDDPDENPFVLNVDGSAVALAATFNAAGDVPATAGSYSATGKTVNLTLNFAPPVATTLTVINNTGPAPITGRFTNLTQGQLVALPFGGNTYHFIANYYGGNGNDLVLLWAANRSFGWGQNASGQIGDGTTSSRISPVPVTATGVLAGKTIVMLASGQGHSLAVCSDGTLAAWGDNTYGQLGDGTTTARNAPVAVMTAGTPLAGKTVVAVTTGVFHSLALCSDGTVAAWGYNNFGQLGDGTTIDRSVPVGVVNSGFLAGKTVVSVGAGSLFSVALCSNGTVASWGYNANGQLGTGAGHSSVPVAVHTATALSGKTVVGISVGVNHTLALCADGTLVSWGFNFAGQLGNGTSGSDATAAWPVAVSTAGALSGKTVVATAAGEHHSLALCSDGTLVSWGQNSSGQLGFIGSNFSVPIGVTRNGTALAGKTVVNIAAGISQSFALCSDGTLTAWGKNDAGQLGDGTTTSRNQAVAVDTSTIAPGERFVRIFSGSNNNHTLALVGSPPPAPEISVFDGDGTGGAQRQGNTGTAALADTLIGDSSAPRTFTIQNTGALTLGSLALAKTGANPGDFTLGALGATTLAPGATTTFTVIFSPSGTGARTAAVEVASNDADENPFVINLAGTGLAFTAQETWRQTHFGTVANSGFAANAADPDGDGLANLVEYALGLDPLVATTTGLPQVSATATDWVYTYTRPAATTEVTYVVEVSTNLSTWSTVGVTHAMVSSSGGTETWQALYPLGSVSNVFFRLQVTTP